MAIKVSIALLLACVVAGFISCVSATKTHVGTDDRSVANGAIHWVHDARLREIMEELDREMLRSWPQEVENEYAKVDLRKHEESLAEARELADALASAANRIPSAVSIAKMAEVDRRSFLAQVETLRDQAGRLSSAAGSRDPDAMRYALDTISATCHSCHQRFRDFAGPME